MMEQRIIKVRGWSKSHQGMTDAYTPYQLLARTDDLAAKLVPEDDIIWMQFTGLLDKNGREIYEGDIVKSGKLGRPEIVKWGEVIGNSTDYPDNVLGIGFELFLGDDPSNTGAGAYEVIGNIYQTPLTEEADAA